MSNVIYRDTDNSMIGYAKDIATELKEQIMDYVKENNWEEAKDLCDLILDLNAYADSDNLLVVSDNNGMGYTIKEYEKE